MSKSIILKRKLTKRERKQAFSSRTTKNIIRAMKSTIKDPRVRKEAISMIKALDLKRIRNTSET